MCSVEFHRVSVVVSTRVAITLTLESSFTYLFIVRVILPFFLYITLILVIVDFARGCHEFSEASDRSSIADKFVLHEVLKTLLVYVAESFAIPTSPS